MYQKINRKNFNIASQPETAHWDYPEFCITTKMRCKIELIFQGGSGVGYARLVYNITPTKTEVKGRPYSFIEASPAA